MFYIYIYDATLYTVLNDSVFLLVVHVLSSTVRGCGSMSEIVWAYTGTKNWQTTAIISLLVKRNMFGGPPTLS